MPSPDPRAAFTDALTALHREAGRPSLRDIQREIKKKGRPEPSVETIRRALNGIGPRPPRWATIQGIFLSLCESADLNPDEPADGGPGVSRRRHLKALWNDAVDAVRPAAGVRDEPPQPPSAQDEALGRTDPAQAAVEVTTENADDYASAGADPMEVTDALSRMNPGRAAATLSEMSPGRAAAIREILKQRELGQAGDAERDELGEPDPVGSPTGIPPGWEDASPAVTGWIESLPRWSDEVVKASFVAMTDRAATMLLNDMRPEQAAWAAGLMDPEQAATAVKQMSQDRAIAVIAKMDPYPASEALSRIDPHLASLVIPMMDPEQAAHTIDGLDPERSASALLMMDSRQAAAIVNWADRAGALDVFDQMDPASVHAILNEMNPEQAAALREISKTRESDQVGDSERGGRRSPEPGKDVTALGAAGREQPADDRGAVTALEAMTPKEVAYGLGQGWIQRPPADTLTRMDPERVGAVLNEMDPVRAASMLNELDPRRGGTSSNHHDIMMNSPRAAAALNHVNPERAGAVLNEMDPVRAASILNVMDPDRAAAALNQVAPEPAADILERVFPGSDAEILKRMDPLQRAAVLKVGRKSADS